VSGILNEPFEPSSVGIAPNDKPILLRLPLNLSIACSATKYSPLPIAPTIEFNLLRTAGLPTSDGFTSTLPPKLLEIGRAHV